MKKKKTGIMQKGIVLVMCLVALLSLASCGSYKEVRSVDDLEEAVLVYSLEQPEIHTQVIMKAMMPEQ